MGGDKSYQVGAQRLEFDDMLGLHLEEREEEGEEGDGDEGGEKSQQFGPQGGEVGDALERVE